MYSKKKNEIGIEFVTTMPKSFNWVVFIDFVLLVILILLCVKNIS